VFTAHDRAGDRPGNEATLRAFRARKQRWRAASFPFNDRCVCAQKGARERGAMKGSILLTPFVVSLLGRKRRAKCVVRTLPSDSAPDGGDRFA